MLLHYFCLLLTLLVSPITTATASYVSYQCLNGKGCTFDNPIYISNREEAEFRNIVFDGGSYFAYSKNDNCNSPPKWIPLTKVCERMSYQL